MLNSPNSQCNKFLNKQPQITEEALRQGQKFRFGNFLLNDKGIFYVQKEDDSDKTKVKRIAGPMFISETSRNLDEEKVYIVLNFKLHDLYCKTTVSKGQLSVPSDLVKLNDKGAEIPFEFRNLITTYFREQEKKVLYQEVYTKIGFYFNKKDEWRYFHSQVYPDRRIPTFLDEKKAGIILTPKGSKSKWLKVISEEVIGHSPAEFMLALGFSAPVVGYLSQVISSVSTIFVHLNADSTVGKTSASMLAVSPFGLADPKSPYSLVRDWGDTSNRITEDFNGNMGVPIVLDEMSKTKEKELSAIFYTIASGKGKGRLTDKIEKRDRATWATTIISNGEISAFNLANKNKGLKVRIKQFNDVMWTKSAENANHIRQTIQHNYGHAGIEFVKYMFAKGLPDVKILWRSWEKQIQTTLTKRNVTERVAADYAVIMTAVTLANESLDLGLNEDNILAFIIEHEEHAAVTRDVGTLAYEEIKQVLIQHQANFRHDGHSSIPQNCWGKIIYHTDHIEFAVLKDVMKRQLQERGFENIATVLKDWDKEKLLKTEGDRKSSRIQIFNKEEQEERKRILGGKSPKKLEDTTYNLLIPRSELEGLLARKRISIDLDNNPEI